MELTSEQQIALEAGQPVSPQESYAAIEAVLDQEPDPGLDSYQPYKQRYLPTRQAWK